MQLVVGRRAVRLPRHGCQAEDVKHAVERINPPFVVMAPDSANRFAVRRRVFLTAEDVRVECENEGELGLACKLVAEDHNRWRDSSWWDDQTQACVAETEGMELAAQERLLENGEDSSGEEAKSDEDISIEEWGQMGYKWFRREEVTYI
jgi:hypothetical protein